jgi:uncharacterized protein with LGFP repeats
VRTIRASIATVLVTMLFVVGGISPADASTVQSNVVSLVNQNRAAAGLPPLRHDPTLDAAAQQWAAHMSATGVFAHSSAAWRAERIPAGWRSNGENIAAGYRSESAVMAGWMNSPGHRNNILNSGYTRIGIGYVAAGNYWVQIFAGYPGDTPLTPAQQAIDSAYASASATLGAATSGYLQIGQNGGGMARAYQNGSIYWTSSTGAHPVSGGYRDYYFSLSGAAGPLGWPTTGVLSLPSRPGGAAQAFTLGSIYSSTATGTHGVVGDFRNAYFTQGGATGVLGWPTSEVSVRAEKGGGRMQSFETGVIYGSAAGVFPVASPFLEVHRSAGGLAGELGWPHSGSITIPQNGGGFGQAFGGGSIYSSVAGTFAVSGPTLTAYFGVGGSAGSLGWPTGAMVCGSDGSCSQPFQKGTIYATSSGTRIGLPAIEQLYASLGGPSGTLGARQSGLITIPQNGGGFGQAFGGGSIYSSVAGTFAVSGPTLTAYFGVGGSAGSLGWPTGAMVCGSDGSCSQPFQKGTIYATSSGTRIG